MIYAVLDGIDKPASRLVYGTTFSANQGMEEKAYEEYEIAYENGFRIFDTAYAYGKGENTLGKWLERSGHRKDVIILDKGFNPCASYCIPDVYSGETIKTQINESLERLRTDYADLYLLHRDDPSKPIGEIVEVLNQFYEEGKIGRFGGSNWTMKRILEANAYAEKHGLQGFTICGPNYTYARLIRDPWGGSVTLTGRQNQDFRDFLTENQMPVFNYSSLGRGFLSGKYRSDNRKPIEECIGDAPIQEYFAPENVKRLERAEKLAAEYGASVPQIGIAWLMKQKLNLFPLVAPTSREHIEETVKGLEIELTDEQMQYLDKEE